MTAAYVEDTDRLGLGRPDSEPLATETIDEIVALIADLIEGGHAYESERGRLLPRPQLRRLRQALQPRPRADGPGRGGRHRLAEGGPARLRPVEGDEGRRGHLMALALGRRAPRLAHRVLGDGRGRARPRLRRSTAAAPTWSSPTTRTRSPRPRPPAASPWPASGCTTGWSSSTRRRCRSRRATSSSSPRRSTATGPEAVVAFLASGHYRQPLAFSDELLTEVEGPRRGNPQLPAGRPGRRARPLRRVRAREEFLDALADDFNTPRAFAALAEIVAEGNRRELAGARAVLEELLPLLGLDSAGRRRAAPTPRPSGCSPSARRPGRPRTSSAPTRSATSSPSWAGRSATGPAAPGWSAA